MPSFIFYFPFYFFIHISFFKRQDLKLAHWSELAIYLGCRHRNGYWRSRTAYLVRRITYSKKIWNDPFLLTSRRISWPLVNARGTVSPAAAPNTAGACRAGQGRDMATVTEGPADRGECWEGEVIGINLNRNYCSSLWVASDRDGNNVKRFNVRNTEDTLNMQIAKNTLCSKYQRQTPQMYPNKLQQRTL